MASEFASLSDLAISKGIKHSTLLLRIHNAILKEYQNRNPKDSDDIDVVVDENSGKVRLFKGTNDVTPTDFISDAERIAREVIIDELKMAESKNSIVGDGIIEDKIVTESDQIAEDSALINKINRSKVPLIKLFAAVIFWIYNGIYGLVLILNFLSLLDSGVRNNFINSYNSLGIYKIILFIILTCLPFVSMGLAYITRNSNINHRILKIFFLFEIPILTITLIALNSTVTFTPAMVLVHLMLLLIPLIFIVQLSNFKFKDPRFIAAYLAIQQTVFSTSFYICLLFAFFVPLILVSMFKNILGDAFSSIFFFGSSVTSYPSAGNILIGLIMLFFGILGIAFIALLIALPYAVTYFFYKMVLKSRETLLESFEEKRVNLFQVIVAAIFIISLVGMSYQPNIVSLVDKLSQFGKATTYEEKELLAKDLIPNKDKLRQAILDAYNFRQRYLFAKGDDIIAYQYENILGFDSISASLVQYAFINLAYPFVYQGETAYSSDLNQNYMNIFDESYYIYPYTYDYYVPPTPPIETTYVQLVSRNVKVNTDYQGLLATVTLEDEFKNTLYSQQEVIYEFSLPNDAVITNLKLGPNLEYDGVIAPKGAAQKTYQAELNKSRDPALLEQTGPRQYRLRVFPIPALNDSITLKGQNQKVQFSYVVAGSYQGYALPSFNKLRNININDNTIINLVYNNNTYKIKASDTYFNSNETKQLLSNLCQNGSKINSKKETNKVFLTPLNSISEVKDNYTCSDTAESDLSKLIQGYKVAIYLDASFKNKDSNFPKELKSYLSSNTQILEKNTIDLFFYNTSFSQANNINKSNLDKLDQITYFGKEDLNSLLSSVNENYDLIIIAPGKTEYTFGPTYTINKKTPIYFVYQENKIPPFTNYLTNYLMQKNGGVFNNINQAINNFAISKQLDKDEKTLKYLSLNPYWVIQTEVKTLQDSTNLKLDDLSISDQTDPLINLFNKFYLQKKMRLLSGDIINQLTSLDNAHNFATKSHIITPYSSLISLVNDAQRQSLEANSQSYDRFRESSTVTNVPVTPPIVRSPLSISPQVPQGITGSSGFSNLTIPSLGSSDSLEVSKGVSPGGVSVGASSAFSFGSTGLIILLNIGAVGIAIFVFVVIKIRSRFVKSKS